MTKEKYKTLKLSDINTGNDFIELTAKEKYGKQIEVIDYMFANRDSYLLREKLPELERINMKEEYIVMSFQEVQDLFEKEGFDNNTYLINDEKGIKDFGPCAYFVKKEWLNKITNNSLGRCPNVENAATVTVDFKNLQIKNQEQTLLWTLYAILDKLAIEGEARDIAIRDFKEHLINKDL